MAFQPLPDGMKAVLIWGDALRQWTNTLYFTQPSFDATDMQVLADFVQDSFENLADIYLSDQWDILDCTVYDMRTSVGQVVHSLRPPYSGTQTGGPAPINAALVATFYTAQRGRSGRGRNYITGFADTDIGPTSFDNAVKMTNISTWWTGFRDSMDLNPWTWVVASGQQNGVVLPQLVPYEIEYVNVRSSKFGSQRRRIARD